jgi:hypothetical protein
MQQVFPNLGLKSTSLFDTGSKIGCLSKKNALGFVVFMTKIVGTGVFFTYCPKKLCLSDEHWLIGKGFRVW